MTSTLSWTIRTLTKSNTPIDNTDNVVIRVDYDRVCTDGEASAKDTRAMEFDRDALSAPFKDLANITETDVIGWIEAYEAEQLAWDEDNAAKGTKLDVQDAALTAQVAALLAPAAETVDLPWVEED